MSPFGAMVRAGLLAAPFKGWGFLSLESSSWDTDPLCAQHLPLLLCTTFRDLGATGTNGNVKLWLPVALAML